MPYVIFFDAPPRLTFPGSFGAFCGCDPQAGSANPELRLLVEPDAAIVPIVAAAVFWSDQSRGYLSGGQRHGAKRLEHVHGPASARHVCVSWRAALKTMDLMLKDLKVRDASSYGFLPVLCVCIVEKNISPPLIYDDRMLFLVVGLGISRKSQPEYET